MSVYFRQHHLVATDLSPQKSWSVLSPIESAIKAKVEQKGIPLKNWDIRINYGIKTGYNDAFIIDRKTRDLLINKSSKNAEIIRPILKGRNINRYYANASDMWIINSHNGLKRAGIPRIDVKSDYPVVYDYFLQFEKRMTQRQDQGDHWTNLRNCAYVDHFQREKIIWLELTDSPKFAYDNEQKIIEATAFMMTGENLKYLCAFLNTKICEWYFDKITASSGAGTNRWKKIYIERLPVPYISASSQRLFIELLDQIIERKRANKPFQDLEEELNAMAFRLFDLTQEEVGLVTSSLLSR
ncbi:type IIS restriction-modification protein [candidate division TM7 genomosp. GTL1]|nr:type IIS restriction-modification protein [candidate division TM7 genomosp. GTL1]